MSERKVYFNGSFRSEADAKVSIYDTALSTGEKVVEVSRTFDHIPYRLDSHLNRLYSGLSLLDINPGVDIQQMREITQATLAENYPTQSDNVDWQILHYVSKGSATQFEIVPEEDIEPTVIIHCIPLVNRLGKMAKKYVNGTDLVVVEQRAMPQDVISPQIKSNGRMDHVVGRIQAKKKMPGSTGILLDREGFLTEGTGSSLFLVDGDEIQTAPTSRVLDGLTREMVFEIADKLAIPIEEKDLTVADAEKASEIFVTSTVICQLHGRTFNGELINDGLIGPITRQVRQAFIEEVGIDFARQAKDYAEMVDHFGPIR